MGWKPWEVRQTTFADFMAAYDGWRAMQPGGNDPRQFSPEEAAALRAEAFK